MRNPRLASRYAKSLLDLSVERGQLEQVHNDMQYLQQLTSGSREFLALMRSPVVSADKKLSAIKAVAGNNISELSLAFISLLVSKSREAELPEISLAFINQYKVHKGINTVKLTTAVPVSEAVKQSIVAQVQRTSNLQQIELESVVDPRIIGGFVLQTGDKLIDASIADELRQVSRQFENNDFIYKVR